MLIAEIFHSLQGEGELTGVPSVFIRASGCNLRCRWCDTPYASWNPEGEELGVPEILERVRSFGCRQVVITGGEPMIAPGMPDLCRALREESMHITIETAATVPPDGIACDLASLSPKLSNSTPDDGAWSARHEQRRLQPAVIRAWIEHYPFQLKFVVTAEGDLIEIQALLDRLETRIPADRIFLMPEGTDVETLRRRSQWLAEVCKQTGYRYGSRLHIELFGHTRGT